MKIIITYNVADNETYDKYGRKEVRIVESYDGVDAPDRHFIVPGFASTSFIRARRAIAQRVLESEGYAKSEPIDWSFLEKGTKQ